MVSHEVAYGFSDKMACGRQRLIFGIAMIRFTEMSSALRYKKTEKHRKEFDSYEKIFWKKAVAACLAVMIVSGGVPAEPFVGLTRSAAITASAESVFTDVVSLQDLQQALETGGSCKLMNDISLTQDLNLKVCEGTDVTLDLNGYTIKL